MRHVYVSGILFAFAMCSTAAAQEPPVARLFPGFVSVSSGTVSPSEAGNVIGTTTADQGVTGWQSGSWFLVGYASVSWRTDSQGYAWNNNTPVTVGARLVKSGTFGVLQANAGMTAVTHTSGGTRVGPTAYLSYWSGWRNDRSRSFPLAFAFPGHVWASSGDMTPLERHNWITTVSAEEGVSVLRGGSFEVVPYGAATVITDTQHRAWNNKTSVDLGLKVQRFVPGGVIEAGVARRDEHERLAGVSRAAPVLFVNLWLGWDPRHVSK